MSYKCNPCKYITDRKSSLDKHFLSLKHIKKSESSSKKAKTRLKTKRVDETKNNLKDQLISVLQKNNEYMKQNNEYIKKKSDDTESFLKKLLEGAGSVANKQMSAINYILQKFPNAPEIKQIENFSGLANENDLVKTLIHHYDNKNLVAYLGDFIIDYYKNDTDPDNQTLWNSDIHRLTYIIRLSIGGKLDWHVDKDAVKLINLVIQPILINLRKEIYDRVKATHPETINYVEFQTSAAKIIKCIDDESLAKELARHIAPKFQVTKNT